GASANSGHSRTTAISAPAAHSAVPASCTPRALQSTTPSGRWGRYASTPAVTVWSRRSERIRARIPGTSGTSTRGGTQTSTSSIPGGSGTSRWNTAHSTPGRSDRASATASEGTQIFMPETLRGASEYGTHEAHLVDHVGGGADRLFRRERRVEHAHGHRRPRGHRLRGQHGGGRPQGHPGEPRHGGGEPGGAVVD